MPPEQLVAVPVPQVPERPGTRELHEVLRRLQKVEEATRWGEQNALLEEEEMDEDEEEEEVRARGSFLTSVLVAGAGTCLLAASALMDGSAPLHTMSLSSIQTHGSACGGGWLGLGPGTWHPLDPSWVPLPVPGAGKIHWEHGVRGLASLDPLLRAFRCETYHRSWKLWRCFSMCLLRLNGLWYASATDHAGTWRWPACTAYFHRRSSWTRLLTCLLRP